MSASVIGSLLPKRARYAVSSGTSPISDHRNSLRKARSRASASDDVAAGEALAVASPSGAAAFLSVGLSRACKVPCVSRDPGIACATRRYAASGFSRRNGTGFIPPDDRPADPGPAATEPADQGAIGAR